MRSIASAGGGSPFSVEATSGEDAAGRIAAAARYLQRVDPRSPASYLLLRGFRWGELRAHGGALDPRLLAAPPTDIRTRLQGPLLDGKRADLPSGSGAGGADPGGGRGESKEFPGPADVAPPPAERACDPRAAFPA